MRPVRARLLVGAAPALLAALTAATCGHAAETAGAPAAADAASAESSAVEEVVVTGVRGQPRTIANSPVPIDIIGAATLTQTGRAGLKEILSTTIPSLTLPAQNGGGTSASVPPYAVEGLTGDYVLVLVNGKRRHNTALINNLATIGGGSTPVDLDLIPPGAIDHIEYLRNGAAAQYGSDAITGVINIILKDQADGGAAETTAGQTDHATGRLLQENADWGLPFFGGAIHLALNAVHNEPAPANSRSSGVLYPLAGGALDPREATANTDYGAAYGRSTLNNAINLSYDLTTPVGDGLEFYSFSTFSYRAIKDGRGAYRPDDLPSLPQIFPNGFQAYRLIDETDFQVAAGLKGQTEGWKWDLSSTFGRDYDWLGAANTLNASLGPSVDQTHFHLGDQTFEQWTNTLDVSRGFNLGLAKPLDVSWGLEQRWEQFSQGAGEPNSYINGGYQVPNGGTPFDDLYHGQFPQAGLQSFTGTSPADASTHSRSNYAAYLDLGTNIIEPWYVGLAGRVEHYDDSSGDSVSGKFTTRYEILPGLALRGSVNNGFHAPSLAEEWFSTTQNTTVVVDGQGISAQSKFLPVANPIAKALGATPLRPETSLNYSVGVTYEPIRQLRLTVDVYQIDIDNRIVKSSPNFSLTAAQVVALGFPGLSSAQFFTNGVDTRTQGIDVVADYQKSFGDFGVTHWSAVFSANGTDITRIKASAANFTPLAERQLTEQTPRYRLALGPDWDIGKWRVHLLETLYGPYEEPVNNTIDAEFHPKWITDLDVSYAVRRNLILAIGADNMFNAYPTRVPAAILAKTAAVDSVLTSAPGYSRAAYGLPESGGGIYGSDSPFGLEGGFYYVRTTLKF
jgi:iron complex outermembrane receptor protein